MQHWCSTGAALVSAHLRFMDLITASESECGDESIHTLTDRRMVISLMSGAFDQDLNDPCANSHMSVLTLYFELHIQEMHL